MENVVISIKSEKLFTDVLDKIDELGGDVVETRYDLLWKRYEIHVNLTPRQSDSLRSFIKNRNTDIMDFET